MDDCMILLSSTVQGYTFIHSFRLDLTPLLFNPAPIRLVVFPHDGNDR